MDFGALDGLLSTEYVSKGSNTKQEVTLPGVLNDLRVGLEKISARVHGRKPRKEDDPAPPRSKSRASDDALEMFVADVGNGEKMDHIQLIKEISEILDDIAVAPSASRKKKGGGGGGEPAFIDQDPTLEGEIVHAIEDGVTGHAAAPPYSESVINTPDAQEATFGGRADLEAAFDGSASSPPYAAPAAITAQRYPNAAFGGNAAGLDAAFDGSTSSPPYAAPAAITAQRYPNAAFGGNAPLGDAFSGSAENPPAAPAAMIGQSRPTLTHEQRMTAAGGSVEPKLPNRDFVATREMYGGVAPVAPLGHQPAGAPSANVLPDLEPVNGDFRVIQVPDM
nr:hypothetical protein TetV2_00404 [Oceanusvirus sp.]